MARDPRGIVLLGLMGGLFLAAMDATILAIAMPDVVADLGGDALYAWGFTVYMLAVAVSMPVLGALSDAHGRRRFFLATLAVFVVGSVACGLSPSMPWFLAARFLQGLGAGGLLSIPFAVAGALFQGAERGRALGRLASVWGVAAIAGPVIGGAAVEFLSWHWVFYMNIPVGLLGAWAVARYHPAEDSTPDGKVDLVGALVFMAGVAALLASLESTVPRRPLVALGGAALIALFLWRERNAPRPILPLDLFRRRDILSANLASALSAMAIFVPIAFVPRFAEATLGDGGAVAAVLPLSIGWSMTSALIGRHLKSAPRIRAAGLGGLALLGGSLAAAPVTFGLGAASLGATMLLVGTGMGLLTPALLLVVQNAVAPARMGVATASQTFLRNVGGAVGIVALGALIPVGEESALAGLAPALWGAAAVAGCGLLLAFSAPKIAIKHEL